MSRVFLFSMLLSISLLALGLSACVPSGNAPKPDLKGANEKFITSGSADDADASNGPAVNYSDPARTGKDANTTATSDPKTFRLLGGEAIAQPGANAPAGSNAGAIATNKATSTFEVAGDVTCQYSIDSTVSAALNRGFGRVRVVVRVLDQNNRPVPGSDFQVVYEFRDKGNNQIGVTVNNEKEIQVANPAVAWQDNDRMGPAKAFALTKGTYTFLFEVNIEASAPQDARAAIKAISSVDLK